MINSMNASPKFLIGSMIVLFTLFHLSLVEYSSAQAQKPADAYAKRGHVYDLSASALKLPNAATARQGSSSLATGFETADGFSANLPCNQNGWQMFAASEVEGHIDTISASSGTQHIRIDHDTAVADNTDTGCFSPDVGPLLEQASSAQVDIAISDTGGADYDFLLQAPSQGFITARVKFSFLGNILVVDENASNELVYVDTGEDWDVGVYRQIRVEVNPATQQILYYYDNELIHTGALLPGTVIEQAILMSDNWHSTDVGDFDNFSMNPEAVTATTAVYLPLLMKPGVPPASSPVLQSINNTDGDGNYDLTWSAVSDTTNYIVEESTAPGFVNATTIYSGPDTTTSVSGKGLGTYYYRVRATNSFGMSAWSNTHSVEVTIDAEAASAPCLLLIKKLHGGEENLFIACLRSGPRSINMVRRYDPVGAISGFDITISDSQGTEYYWATIEVERDGFGRVDSYEGTISSLDFPSFTQQLQNVYDEFGGISSVTGIKLYLDSNNLYSMNPITPCPSGLSWSGYQANITGGPYINQWFTIGNCS